MKRSPEHYTITLRQTTLQGQLWRAASACLMRPFSESEWRNSNDEKDAENRIYRKKSKERSAFVVNGGGSLRGKSSGTSKGQLV